MNILSLFDGISCLQLALNRANIAYDNYYASEIKKSAIKVTQSNFPNTIQLGDIKNIHYKDGVLYTENGNYEVGTIDIMGGGSPCQDFSTANIYKHEYGLKGERSRLFFEYLRLLHEVKPKYFLLENVKMKSSAKEELDNYLGTIGMYINSSLVSYQNRPRYYWTNIPNVVAPKDRHISFQDYKETNPLVCAKYKLKKTPSRLKMWNNGGGTNSVLTGCANVTFADKIYCITAKQDRCPNSGLIECEDFCRFLTRAELEQAQTIPVGYTDMLSYSQMQDVVGNAWTVDVIAHILSFYTKASDKTK